MLRTHHLCFAGALLLSTAIAAGGGCVVKTTNTTGVGGSASTTTGEPTSTTDTTSTSTSMGGSGGVGGMTTTGTGGSSGCTGQKGTGIPKSACETIPIAPPETCVDMGQTIETYGYTACAFAAMDWNDGNWEEFEACLSQIDKANECDPNFVVDCVSKTRNDACDDPVNDTNCTQIHDNCAAANPPQDFDTSKCENDMKIYNDAGFKALLDCFNMADPSLTCQQAYDTCFANFEQ